MASAGKSEKLGPYEIVSLIGAGGMGEVWKARDTRLDRFVAIKKSRLPFSDRFAREAKAIAALNHPHICHLYDVGPDYLVMEYVEGSPLKGPLPLDNALQYAEQILSALEAAHRNGIIHRDLKPGNILVTKHHGIKLLDFGVARMLSGSADSALTQTGEMMGTPGYMAPEQWEGKPGDARTDIYCFGCVLYELLTGKRVTQEPRSTLAPPVVDRIVRTCLEQDPDDRWQTVSDLRRAMSLPATPAVEPTRAWLPIVLTGLLLLAGGWLIGSRIFTTPAAGKVVSFQIYPPRGTVWSESPYVTVSAPQFALAPDGSAIVFAAGAEGERPGLWRRSMDNIVPERLPGTEDAQEPFWSPDGRWIAFFAGGKLKKIPAEGGVAQVIVPAVRDVRGGAWGPDGTILFAFGADPMQRVSAGGTPGAMGHLSENEVSQRYPVFLPQGRHFLYLVPATSVRNLYAGSLDDSSRKLVPGIHNSVAYADPGYLFYVENGTLFAQGFNPDRLDINGERFPVADHVGLTTTYKSAVSASSRALAYSGTLSFDGDLTWIDRSGHRWDAVGPKGYYTDFRLSPDEKTLAASRLGAKTGILELWMRDLERGSSNRIAEEGASMSASPIWSPDGTHFAFRMSSVGVGELHYRSAAGGGADKVILPRQIAHESGVQANVIMDTDWAPDGKSIVFEAPGTGSGSDLWLLPLTGDKKPTRLLASPFEEMHGNFSPDGHMLAYTSDESGSFQVYVQTLPLSEKKWQVSTGGGYEPRWRSNGREIYYLSSDRKLMAVPVGPGPTFGVPKELFQTRVPRGVTANHTHYVPSRDGQRFLVNELSNDAAPTSITVVLNWLAGVKK